MPDLIFDIKPEGPSQVAIAVELDDDLGAYVVSSVAAHE
jgi:hypothetical protein